MCNTTLDIYLLGPDNIDLANVANLWARANFGLSHKRMLCVSWLPLIARIRYKNNISLIKDHLFYMACGPTTYLSFCILQLTIIYGNHAHSPLC